MLDVVKILVKISEILNKKYQRNLFTFFSLTFTRNFTIWRLIMKIKPIHLSKMFLPYTVLNSFNAFIEMVIILNKHLLPKQSCKITYIRSNFLNDLILSCHAHRPRTSVAVVGDDVYG